MVKFQYVEDEVKEEPKKEVVKEKVSQSNILGLGDLEKNISQRKVTQDKKMPKDEIIKWISSYIQENKELLPLDFLRGQKLIYETMIEMRK